MEDDIPEFNPDEVADGFGIPRIGKDETRQEFADRITAFLQGKPKDLMDLLRRKNTLRKMLGMPPEAIDRSAPLRRMIKMGRAQQD